MESAAKAESRESGAWTTSGLTIEYPLDLIDGIRLSASSNFHSDLQGGTAIAGVFYGRRSENGVRIESWHPVSCERAQGPSFRLSEQEVQALKSMTASSEPLGWFVSHNGGDLALTAGDRVIFDECFPRRGQFTLVLAPGRIGPTRAAVWVRGAESSAAQEFTIQPLYATRARRGQPVLAGPPPQAVVPHKAGRRAWRLWLCAVLVLAAAVVAFIAGQRSVPRRDSLSLRLQDRPGAQLQIAWDAQAITPRRHGLLEIEDGGSRKTVVLEPSRAGENGVTYARRSGEVKVRLAVFDEGSAAPAVQELARFVGLAPGEVEQERAVLRAEIDRLRAELAQEQEKARRRERLIRQLQEQ